MNVVTTGSTVQVASTPTLGGFVEATFSGVALGGWGYIVLEQGHVKVLLPPGVDGGVDAR